MTNDSGWDQFWGGDPLIIVFQYVLLVPLILLAVAAFGETIKRTSNSAQKSYWKWLTGKQPDS